MKRSARILSLLLAVLMLAVCFAACKKDDQQKDNVDDNKLDLSKTDSWTDEQSSSALLTTVNASSETGALADFSKS